MYLLDTNVLSATFPGNKGTSHAAFAAWVLQNSHRLFLSVITIVEVEVGIARADRIGAMTKAAKLRRWVAGVEHLYKSRILPFDVSEARYAGVIIDRARAHHPGFEDIAIAATAAVRKLTVLTANERHFAPLGVPFVNPLKSLPA